MTPIISGCALNSNTQISKESIVSYISNSFSWGSLCWLSDNLKEYLIDNPSELEKTESFFIFQIILSSLSLSNDTVIYNQPGILDAFISTINISDITIRDIEFNGVSIQVTASNAYLNNLTIGNTTTQTSRTPIIQTSLDTYFYLNGIDYRNWNVPMFNLLTSSGDVYNLYADSNTMSNYMTIFDQTTNATLQNWTIINTNWWNGYVIYFYSAYIHSIKDWYFDDLIYLTGRIRFSTVNLMQNITSTNIYWADWWVYDSNINKIENYTSIDNGRLSNRYGGVFSFFNWNVTITNSIFDTNTGTSGGALFYRWDRSVPWYSSITDSEFLNNDARDTGGAIYYDAYRPEMDNITFYNNTAPQGNDISSYPIKIVLDGTNSSLIHIEDTASGQETDIELKFSIVDADNQISTDTEGGQITVSAVQSGTSVLGGVTEEIINGVATFRSLIFKAPPGSKNVEYRLSSTAIDSSTLLKQYGRTSIQDPMTVSFRYCKPGEISLNDECQICSAGTYSFGWNSTVWENCMDNAEWLGGVQVYVDSGYWRESKNSSSIIECLRESAWQGGYQENQEHPVRWASGYEGVLCTECQIINGQKYERLTNFECSKCPDILLNALRIAGLILLVSIFFIVLIVVAIRKRKESQQSILLRILANYLQLLTATLSFDMKFPKVVTEVFYPVQQVGSSSEAFLSIDCFLRDTELKAFAPSNAIFKIFLTGMLPLALIIVTIITWSILHLILFKWLKDLKRNIIVTIVVILFLMHPMLTKVGLEIFQWVKVDEDKYQVRIDLDIGWFSWEHMKWSIYLSIPIIIVWVIGTPLLLLLYLCKNRHSLKQWKMQRYFLILYQGLTNEAFYWEFINTVRKFLMVAINVFMSTLPLVYSAITAVISLIALVRVQMRIHPYKLELNNKLEIEAIITGSATLFWGVLFVSDDNDLAILVVFILLIIIALNIKFLLFWCFCMTFTLAGKHKTWNVLFMMIAVGMLFINKTIYLIN